MADGGMASSGGDMVVGILSIRGDGPNRCCTGDDHICEAAVNDGSDEAVGVECRYFLL